MSVWKFVNVALFVVIAVECQRAAEFPYFFNLWSVDVRDLDKYDFSRNNCGNCPRIFLPVCGDDNKTYTNECQMACKNAVLKKSPKVNVSRTGPCDVFYKDNDY